MQEPLKKTGDIPTNDSYPAPSPAEQDLGASVPASAASGRRERNLKASAEQIGSVVGSAVGAVRRQLQVIPRRLDEAKERLTESGGDLRDDMRAAANEWKESARQKIYETRLKTRHYVNENPLQVVGAAALAGFALGVGLRIWRWRRE
ncbi:MAG: hypothetical protein L0Z53_25125 [Acidobacteriales bacterium]|nr:hypothetical protein [Terriglobales bacterium]